jgi:hypothetical protein
MDRALPIPFELVEVWLVVWESGAAVVVVVSSLESGLMVEVDDDLPKELARGARCVSLSSAEPRTKYLLV